jgi:RNA polymerase sigma-70 factor (ECF subfamily)
MLAVSYRYATDYDEAQEITQEGFIKVFSKLNGFKNIGSLEGWIRRIIVNNALDFIRTKKKLVFENNEGTLLVNIKDETTNLFDDKFASKIKAELILELMQKLSPAYKTVFNLYVLEDYTHKEIANILGISIGTSKSNYFKAKAKLIELFNENKHKLDE